MLETKKYFSREFFVFAWKCPKTQRKSIFMTCNFYKKNVRKYVRDKKIF